MPIWTQRALPFLKPRYTFAFSRVGGRAASSTSHQRAARQHVLPAAEQRDRLESWMPYVEAALPRRLRQTTASVDELAADEAAYMLHVAQRIHNLDLLSHLGHQDGRWKAVVWLTTHIVNHLWNDKTGPQYGHSVDHIPGMWHSLGNLDDVVETAITLPAPLTVAPCESLDSVTIDNHIFHDPRAAHRNNHLYLGQLWQSLGAMIIIDASRHDKVTPEILELIALFHHCGFMPSSIYDYNPPTDTTALRQPPTLHLLSSHILTALSDAAWRAHESNIVQEAKTGGRNSTRPELPGSMYNVHVTGLGHEVWLELVLWSCLDGGWILEGASILEQAAKQAEPWTIMNWRDAMPPGESRDRQDAINWRRLAYIFSTSTTAALPEKHSKTVRDRVSKTVSAEVVAAFVHALVNDIRTTVGFRGISSAHVFALLAAFRKLLEHSNMSLGHTSWDSVVLRIVESGCFDVEAEPSVAENMISLSPRFSQEPSSRNALALEDNYTMDATAAPLGHLHRMLHAHSVADNLQGALRVFENIVHVTDMNKRRSLGRFFKQDNLEPRAIDYPLFDPQIPNIVLGPFIDIATRARMYDFVRWLLGSTDVDGPMVSEDTYGDPVLGPALLRFATAVDDRALLLRVLRGQAAATAGGQLPRSTMLGFLESQIDSRNWPAAHQTLQILANMRSHYATPRTVATMVRSLMKEVHSSDKGLALLGKASTAAIVALWKKGGPADSSNESGFSQALHVLTQLDEHCKAAKGRGAQQHFATTLFLLSAVGPPWAELVSRLFPLDARHSYGSYPVEAFDIVLQGVADMYGYEKAREFLHLFWPRGLAIPREADDDAAAAKSDARLHTTRRLVLPRSSTRIVFETHERQRRMPQRPRTPLFRPTQPGDSFLLSLPSGAAGPSRASVERQMSGRFVPGQSTIAILLREAVGETEEDSAKRRGAMQWAAAALRACSSAGGGGGPKGSGRSAAEAQSEVERIVYGEGHAAEEEARRRRREEEEEVERDESLLL